MNRSGTWQRDSLSWLLGACLLVLHTSASAHPLAPSLLEMTERTPGQVEVLWKTPAARLAGEHLEPQLPHQCQRASEVETHSVDTARVERWQLTCSTSLVGAQVGVEGIASSKANVILRIVLADGRKYQSVLSTDQPHFVIPERQPAFVVVHNYVALGVEHILTGWDHLLFVLGLVLLVRGHRRLLWTITAFTVGHSLTLSLAILGVVRISPAPVEALIALSILIVAVELTHDHQGTGTFLQRYPWALAVSFGLLHGLGFAGALAQVGLPPGEIPMALLAFNIGIEVGQLLFIAVVLGARAVLTRVPVPLAVRRRHIPAYLIGSLAAFWFFERLFKMWP